MITFKITNITAHIKKNKSTYQVQVRLQVDDELVRVENERSSLKETVDELADELTTVLLKKKEKRGKR